MHGLLLNASYVIDAELFEHLYSISLDHIVGKTGILEDHAHHFWLQFLL